MKYRDIVGHITFTVDYVICAQHLGNSAHSCVRFVKSNGVQGAPKVV